MARKPHVYSRQTLDLLTMLGDEIARARRARRMTSSELAARAGISRGTLHSVEQGTPTVAVGVVFEVAVLVGIDLFGLGPRDLPEALARSRDRLALVPSSVRHTNTGEHGGDF